MQIHVEVLQENSLCSYLKQAKMSFFFFFFSYTKLGNRRVAQVLLGGSVPVGWGGVEVGKW
jgi:hypothetical protein